MGCGEGRVYTDLTSEVERLFPAEPQLEMRQEVKIQEENRVYSEYVRRDKTVYMVLNWPKFFKAVSFMSHISYIVQYYYIPEIFMCCLYIFPCVLSIKAIMIYFCVLHFRIQVLILPCTSICIIYSYRCTYSLYCDMVPSSIVYY